MNSTSAIIMAGGSGLRLWPLSRAAYPKQFLNLINENSLLQETLKRVVNLNISDIYIICNEDHRFIVADQILQLKIDAKIILEPVPKNTAPAITVASMLCENDSNILVLPSDHYIHDNVEFLKSIKDGERHVENNKIVTFGISPNNANTEYGYIEIGDKYINGNVIKSFKEKPNTKVAEEYLSSKRHYWNSGMFFFKKEVLLDEVNKFLPETYEACQKSVKNKTVDMDFIRICKESFSAISSESIDTAIMEKTQKASMIQLDAGWNDIGSWNSLYNILPKDNDGNHVDGDAFISNVQNSLIKTDGIFVTAFDIQNTLIVATKDAFMISDLKQQKDIKNVVNSIIDEGRDQAFQNREVIRPWGKYDSIEYGNGFQVKKITVNPKSKLSLQLHHKRSEHWVIVSGTALVTKGDKTFKLRENESVYIPMETVHSIENPYSEPLEFIEVQCGSYLGEDDIIRFEDIYGRTKE